MSGVRCVGKNRMSMRGVYSGRAAGGRQSCLQVSRVVRINNKGGTEALPTGNALVGETATVRRIVMPNKREDLELHTTTEVNTTIEVGMRNQETSVPQRPAARVLGCVLDGQREK